jgi:hypothetical protein
MAAPRLGTIRDTRRCGRRLGKISRPSVFIEVSDDRRVWRTAVTRRPACATVESFKFTAIGRFVRLNVDGSRGAWVSVRTLEVLGPEGQRIEPRQPDAAAMLAP